MYVFRNTFVIPKQIPRKLIKKKYNQYSACPYDIVGNALSIPYVNFY